MKKVCIVIPIHKSQPDENEVISLKRCGDILAGHDMFLLAPEGQDVTMYLQINPHLSVKYINPTQLSSIKEYNKLKISYDFYGIFKQYEFLLTYELDAYVFRDELSLWCDRGVDYIGAPWFSGYHQPTERAKITGVGNSGLSLRNIQKCLSVLDRLRGLNALSNRYDVPFSKQVFRLLTFITSRLPILQAKFYIIRSYLQHEYVHEDIFWCKFVPLLLPDFKIATVQDALQFSFDASPRECYQLNGGVLPFGCHAWQKFDPEFWKQFIHNSREGAYIDNK